MIPAPRQVETTAASKGIPVAPPLESIAGLTNIMYAMVINVVTPATISRLTLVFLSWNLKYDKAPSFFLLFYNDDKELNLKTAKPVENPAI
jgi:hypothetical protein